jgi:hypothetical protein
MSRRARWFDYTSASALGIEIVVAVTLPTLAAMWLERNLTHWRPWTTLIGFSIGCGAAGLALARVAREHRQAVEERREEHGDDR